MLLDSPCEPTPSAHEDANAGKENPVDTLTSCPALDTAQDGQEGFLVEKEVSPATSSQGQLWLTAGGDAGSREEPKNQAGSKAVLANEPGTQHQTYSTNLTQAKSLWSKLFSKSSEFDAAMKVSNFVSFVFLLF